MKTYEIHERALRRAKAYLKSEADLIESILEVEDHRTYLEFNCRSLHVYVSTVMGLGDAVASNFITVARKAREVPALQEVIASGKLQVQKARKITSVLNEENKEFWLQLAIEKPQRIVEKEVARVNPQAAKPERIKYISEKRLNVNLNVSEETHELLRRTQDLESQRRKAPASLEQTLEAALKAYLEKNDPLEKAKRQAARIEKEKQTVGQIEKQTTLAATHVLRHIRKSIPANVQHQVNLRDNSQCTFLETNGTRCTERRWLHSHHHKPVSQGGPTAPENLTTLCSGHHRLLHYKNHLSDQIRDYVLLH
jgi:hypothetical protein